MNRRLAAVLAVAALTASACAGAWGRAGALGRAIDLVRATAGRTGGSRTMAFVGSFSFPAPDGSRITAPVEGAVDSRSRRMRLEIDLAAVFPDLLADGGRVVQVWDGRVLYLQFPESLAPELGGRRWLKLDPRARAAVAGSDIQALLLPVRVADPGTSFGALLEGLGGGAEEMGTEQVRGVRTTHYRASIGPAAGATTAVGGLPADIWVDAGGRLRRLAYEVDMSTEPDVPAELNGRMGFDMQVVSTGEPVEAEIPAASETAVLADLIES